MLESNGIQISMGGRGNFRDNIFFERLWWTVKYQYLIKKKKKLEGC